MGKVYSMRDGDKSCDKKDKQKGQRSQVECKREDCEFEDSREGLNEKVISEKRLKEIRGVAEENSGRENSQRPQGIIAMPSMFKGLSSRKSVQARNACVRRESERKNGQR